MLKIYHARHTRGVRVIWTAEEIGVAYELKHMPFDPGSLRSDEFLRINPFGALPAIEDGGVTMTESGAICQYLTERHGHAPFKRTMDDADYATYLQWVHAGEATLSPPLSLVLQHTRGPEDKRVLRIADESREKFYTHLAVIDRALHGKDYLLGDDFTLADVMVGYALHLAALIKLMNDAPPHAAAYWERLKARPAYQKAISA
ncbi:MAG: glutathione S-transferase family protein [Caulobacterales bacterium]